MGTEVTHGPDPQNLAALAMQKEVTPLIHAYADMTLHQLVDEYQKWQAEAEKTATYDEDHRRLLDVAGYVALRKANFAPNLAAVKFGIRINSYIDPDSSF